MEISLIARGAGMSLLCKRFARCSSTASLRPEGLCLDPRDEFFSLARSILSGGSFCLELIAARLAVIARCPPYGLFGGDNFCRRLWLGLAFWGGDSLRTSLATQADPQRELFARLSIVGRYHGVIPW